MARQDGILGIRGTLGGMTFTKNGVVRKARTSNKEQFDGALSMARTRENAGEFGAAATAGKLLRQALRRQLLGTGDRLLTSRLTKAMRKIEAMDTTNPRGKRRVQKAHAGELLGFDFNAGAPLGAVFFAEYTTKLAGTVLAVRLPALVPTVDLTPPAGATHYGLVIGVVILDFEADTMQVVPVTGVPAAAVLDGVAAPAIVLSADLGVAPSATETVVAALGVHFYQQTNGQLYPLNNEGTNPLGVVYAG